MGTGLDHACIIHFMVCYMSMIVGLCVMICMNYTHDRLYMEHYG